MIADNWIEPGKVSVGVSSRTPILVLPQKERDL